MSLTSTLRPSPVSRAPPSSTRPSAEENVPFHLSPTYLTLSRMLLRYQHMILLQPPSDSLSPLQAQVQSELRSPLPYHRTKWLHNIEYARTLLLQLEHSAQAIKVQRSKRDAIRDLAEKRVLIKKLRSRLEELGREAENQSEEAWNQDEAGETLEEILGRPPLPDDSASQGRKHKAPLADGKLTSEGVHDENTPTQNVPRDNAATTPDGKPSVTEPPRDNVFGNTARRRRGGVPPTDDTAATTSGFSSLPTTEKSLLADSRTQETLTTSLVSMAAQLKQQARAFQGALDLDKTLLDRALEGLDKNVSGMAAASKNMAFLRKMSEGQGWFGRLKLYAMILGMWVLAILLVFAGPKLRF